MVQPAFEITSAVSHAEWDGFVRDHIEASAYHLWNWRTVFERAFGHETLYLAAQQDGRVVGILPLVVFRSRLFGRFAVSLPFLADAAGVCARDPRVRAALVERARSFAAAEHLSHVEFRHLSRQMPELPVREHKVGMRLALDTDPDRVFQAFDRKVRNQIRKGEKSGLVVQSGGGELVNGFYNVFARNMRDLGTPVFPVRLFQEAVTTFASTSRVFLVNQGGTVVAGGIALAYRDTLTVPWASSLREYRAQCPNNLLYWHMIRYAIASGLSTFDFGRSIPGGGTYQFKVQWGAQPFPLYWECAPIRRDSLPGLSRENRKFSAAIAAWKRLPLPLTRWLGPRISRSIP